jgi:EmrB/QacA subfamily drug resistance transporter
VDEVSAGPVPAARRGAPALTLAVLGLAAMAFSVLQSLVIPVLPDIGHELGVSQQAVTWVLTGYLLSASVATPILGRLGDMFGKRRILVITMTALAVGTVIAGLATTLPVLLVGRVAQGLGGALFPLSFGIIRDEFPAERVAGAIGFISATLGIGGGLGVILAGPIAARLGYHWLFWAPLPLIVLAAAGVQFLIPESPLRSGGRVNLHCAVLLSAWLVVLLVGITEGPQWGWLSPAFAGTILAAGALFCAWWIAEWRSDSPLVDVRMLIHPAVWRTNVVALAVGFGLYGSLTLIPEILQAPHSVSYGFGVTVTDAGLFLLPQTVVVFVVGTLSGRIAAAIGSARAVLIGVLLAAGSFSLLAIGYTRVWQILTATIMLGAAVGLTYSGMPNVIVESVPAAQTGVATGMNANIRTLGSALGGQVTTSIVTTTIVATSVVSTSAVGTSVVSTGSRALSYPAGSGFTISFIVLAVVSLGAAVVAAGVRVSRGPSR